MKQKVIDVEKTDEIIKALNLNSIDQIILAIATKVTHKIHKDSGGESVTLIAPIMNPNRVLFRLVVLERKDNKIGMPSLDTPFRYCIVGNPPLDPDQKEIYCSFTINGLERTIDNPIVALSKDEDPTELIEIISKYLRIGEVPIDPEEQNQQSNNQNKH